MKNPIFLCKIFSFHKKIDFYISNFSYIDFSYNENFYISNFLCNEKFYNIFNLFIAQLVSALLL